MSIVATPAVVLQTYRYSETSKIVRLATRDLGIQSAIAKGAVRPRSPFGAGLELLSEGVAQLYYREARDLQLLAAFDVVELHRGLAADVGRFAGATALSQVMQRLAPAAPLPAAYDALTTGLAALAAVPPDAADALAVRVLWRLVGVLGFAPSLQACARDGTPVAPGANGGPPVAFSAADGGVLCPSCAPPNPPPPTRLPARAFRDLLALNDWMAPLPPLDPAHTAAHRRLVARFIRHHLGETGALSALDFWEHHGWVPRRTPAAS